MKFLFAILLLLNLVQGNSQSFYIPDDHFEEELIALGYDDVLDDSVLYASIDTVTYLDLGSKYINSLEGIEAFTALVTLICEDNNLFSLDVASNLNLKNLYCELTALGELDVSNNLDLEILYFGFNSIDTIDLSHNLNLKSLNCEFNSIQVLDVSLNTQLNRIIVNNNDLTTLDISDLPALDYLNCRSNELVELDCSHNPELELLICSSNDLELLDVTNCASLSYFDCGYNFFSELDLSENIGLESFQCDGANVVDLNLENNVNLNFVKLQNGLLESLNLKNGNNIDIDFWANVNLLNNPSLTCVTVDDPAFSAATWTEVDSGLVFSPDCESLGVEEASTFEYEVYPNPTSDVLFINVNSDDYSMKIYSVNGEVLMSPNLKAGKNNIDLSGFVKGLYLIEIIGEGSVYSERVIIE
jgi:hypothetical protein